MSEQIGSLLAGAMHRAGISQQVGAALVVQASDTTLEKLFGEGVLLYAQTHTFIEQQLTINCTHATLAMEIRQKHAELIQGVTEIIPNAQIQEIYVRHASRPDRGASWHTQLL